MPLPTAGSVNLNAEGGRADGGVHKAPQPSEFLDRRVVLVGLASGAPAEGGVEVGVLTAGHLRVEPGI